MTQPEHEGNSHLEGTGTFNTGIEPGRPAPGTGIIAIGQSKDGWEGHWSDDQGHMLASPSPMTFPDVLEWARAKPCPEIRIFTGWHA